MHKSKYYHDIDLEDVEVQEPEEHDTMFGHLYEAEDSCPECDYYGPMRSTRRGWRCPKCRTLVVSHDD